MAKKRGRNPLLWTVLGLFFHIVAAIILLVIGHKTPSFSSDPPYDPTPTPAPPTRRTTQVHTPTQQNGHIDLNSLRDAVRRSAQGSVQPPSTQSAHIPNGLEPDRQAFLDSLASHAPTAESFQSLPLGTGQALRSAWIDLGRAFVYSGEAGGISDNNEFYQLGDGEDGDPVLFYPVSQDGTTNSVVIQFAVPLKRFRSPSHELFDWVNQQPQDGFAQAVVFEMADGSETLLLAAGVSECRLVTYDSLGIMCEQVRTLASRLRQTIPQRFGGIWVTT